MKKSAYSATLWLASTSLVAFVPSPSVAKAQKTAQLSIDLPEQRLPESLRALALLSGRTVLADDGSVAEVRAPALRGSFTIEEALHQILAGSGLVAEPVKGGYIVKRGTRTGEGAALGVESRGGPDDIVVTGSRIKGAEIASPLVVLDSQALQDTGYADLGEVARSLPQSFGGGQNPGVGLNVPQQNGVNAGGGSSVNLRGLGSDATLTILNGRRLPYDSALQGVDISAIPMTAVERVEVVADGSSAIYGSDAVGGVVNVILRKDYEGLLTRARLGGATEGGDFQQLYGVLAGHRWDGGGMFVTYEYNGSTELDSNQRDQTSVVPNLTLLPASRRHAVAAHLHQDITSELTFEADALYNHRAGSYIYPLNAASDLDVSRAEQGYKSYSLALAGGLQLSLGEWELGLAGTYGQGHNDLTGQFFYGNVLALSSFTRYANRSASGEFTASGALFALPGGDARLAAGAGIRHNGYEVFRGTGSLSNASPDQDSRYLFGEINLPLIGPENEIAFVRKLTASGALRYEDYDDVGDIATPKLGLVWSPVTALDFKGTWGKSFRAPGFLYQYGLQSVSLYSTTRLGGTGYPAGATALLVSGGNPDLKPERATSWSAGVALRPPFLSGAELEFTYFSTRYKDRIVVPITLTAQALSNPIYAGQLTYAPSAAEQAAIIAGAGSFVNASGAAYDPAAVAVLIDNRSVNAGRQSVHGLDAQARYTTALAGGSASFNLNATYLYSERQVSEAQPVEILSGRIFNPPHWKGRASVAWDHGGLRLTGAVSYIGEILDTRSTPAAHIGGMTTVDLGARYTVRSEGRVFDGLELGLSVSNLLNAMPDPIAATLFYDTPYDSTNYSPVGRFVAFEISKKW